MHENFDTTEINGDKNIYLITEYFKHKHNGRHDEILEVANKNLSSNLFKKVVFLNESENSPINNKNLKQVITHKRSSFKSAMEFANKYLPKNSIVVLANNDIYFDDTLNKVKNINMNGICLALLRHNVDKKGNIRLMEEYSNGWSHDAWILKTPIKIPKDCDFYFGLPGCDNAIAYQFKDAGYRLLNPCRDIKIYHLHNENQVSLSNREHMRVHKKYHLVPCENLANVHD